jgi:phosphopantothenoylcysteine decarboxylase/phosphopantothenate--cysteine ligase
MREKNTDMIVLNSLRDEGAGFGHDSNRITIFDKSGNEQQFDLKSKTEVAGDILDMVFKQIS